MSISGCVPIGWHCCIRKLSCAQNCVVSDTTPGLLSSDLSLVQKHAHVVLLACVYCLLCKGAHYPDVALHFRAKIGEIAPMRFILLIGFTHGRGHYGHVIPHSHSNTYQVVWNKDVLTRISSAVKITTAAPKHLNISKSGLKASHDLFALRLAPTPPSIHIRYFDVH